MSIARLEMLEEIRAKEELQQACDAAEEAAETYHAAWQDAAVYWKDRVKRLEEENARLGVLLAEASR